jgi:hypothetical protein
MNRVFRWKVLRWVVLGLVVVLVGIQLVPVDRANPPVEAEVPAEANVRAILRRACYDCHSNETFWPWYSRIAPISWLVARDVHEGRKELNFSTWNRYTTKQQLKNFKESWAEVAEGEMPPWIYLPVHRDAVLSAEDRRLLRTWALGAAQAPGPSGEK